MCCYAFEGPSGRRNKHFAGTLRPPATTQGCSFVRPEHLPKKTALSCCLRHQPPPHCLLSCWLTWYALRRLSASRASSSSPLLTASSARFSQSSCEGVISVCSSTPPVLLEIASAVEMLCGVVRQLGSAWMPEATAECATAGRQIRCSVRAGNTAVAGWLEIDHTHRCCLRLLELCFHLLL